MATPVRFLLSAEESESTWREEKAQESDRPYHFCDPPARLLAETDRILNWARGRLDVRATWHPLRTEPPEESEWISAIRRALLPATQRRQHRSLMPEITPTCISVPVQSFFPEPLEIIRPFSVVVRGNGADYIATFFDANINASGDTEEEAFSNLKDLIVATFELLSRTSAHDGLGPGPSRQLCVLKQFVKWVE